jgi:hypothetical protein
VCLAATVWTHPWLTLVYISIVGGAWVLFVVFVPADQRATF